MLTHVIPQDKPFETMTVEDYHTAIHAKVRGTWNLHLASLSLQRQPLDFFTLLSSTSGIVGNTGQANYAAANTFLDAFASYRRNLGLHANCVDLGLIEDVGYVAEQGSTTLEARFDKRQWTPINEIMLRKILTYSILQQDSLAPISANSATQIITGIGYPLPAESSPLASEPRFAYLFSTHGANASSIDSDEDSNDASDQGIKAFRLLQKSGTTDLAGLRNAAVDVISAQFMKVLRLDTDPEPGRSLMAYGLDSLSAVELRNWIRVKLGVELTTLDITNAASLIDLGDKVVGKLGRSDGGKN